MATLGRSLRPTQGVDAVQKERADIDGDDLSEHYSAMADDGSLTGQAREAAMLFAIAERHVTDDENDEEAIKTAGEALELFRELKDMAGVADTLRVLINAHRLKAWRLDMKRSSEPMEIARKELEAFKKAGEKRGQACMLLSVCECHSQFSGSSKLDDALKAARQAVSIYKELGDKKMLSVGLLTMSNQYMKLHQASRALKTAKDALEAAKAGGDKIREAKALHAMSIAFFLADDCESGFAHADQALDLFKSLGIQKMVAYEYHSIALWNLYVDDYAEALSPAEEAMSIFRDIGYGKGWPVASLSALVSAYVGMGKAEKALKAVEDALKDVRDKGDKVSEVSLLELLVQTHLVLDDAVQAAKVADESLEPALASVDNPAIAARAMLCMIEVKLQLNLNEEAVELAKKAELSFKGMGDTSSRGDAMLLMVTAYMAQLDEAQAMETAKEVRNLFREDGNKGREAVALLVLSSVHRMTGNNEEGLAAASEAQTLFRAESNRKMEATTLLATAEVHQALGSVQPSIKCARRAHALRKESGNKKAVVETLVAVANYELDALAKTHEELGKAGKLKGNSGPILMKEAAKVALEAAEDALEYSRNMGEKVMTAHAMFNVAHVYLLSGEIKPAKQTIEGAKEICEAEEDRYGIGFAMALQAKMNIMENKIGKAESLLDDVIDYYAELGDEAGKMAAEKMLEHITKDDSDSDSDSDSDDDSDDDESEEEDEEEEDEADDGGGGVTDLSTLDLTVKGDAVAPVVKDIAAGMLGESNLSVDVPLMDAGLDSLSMVEFRNELVKEFGGINLPGALLFDYPTIAAVGDFIAEQITESGPEASAKFLGVDLNAAKSGGGGKKEKKPKVKKEKKPKKKKEKKAKKEESSDEDDDDDDEEEDAGGGGGLDLSTLDLTVGSDKVAPIIRDVAQGMLGEANLSIDVPLMDAGLDSLSMVEFRNELVKEFGGVNLPGALLFDYPTISAVAGFIADQIMEGGQEASAKFLGIDLSAAAGGGPKKEKKKKEKKEKPEKKKKEKKEKKKKKRKEESEDEEDDDDDDEEEEGGGGTLDLSTMDLTVGSDKVAPVIRDVAQGMLGEANLSIDVPLMDAGLDSLSMVEFRNELVKEFGGVNLPGALLFDYPTISAVAGFIADQIMEGGPEASAKFLGIDLSAAASGGGGKKKKEKKEKKEKPAKKEKKKKEKKKKKKKKADDSDDDDMDVDATSGAGTVAVAKEIIPITGEMVSPNVKDVALGMLGLSGDELPVDVPLMDAGLDSLSMVEFRNELIKEFGGINLPGALLFDHPTIGAVSSFIAEQIMENGMAGSFQNLTN